MSIAHALSLTAAIQHRIDCATNDPNNLATTPVEIAEAKVEKDKAQAALASSIAIVDQTLAALRKAAPKESQSSDVARKPTNALRDFRATAGVKGALVQSAMARDDALDNVKEAMSAKALEGQTKSLEDMAKAVGPIVDKFDDVLKKPYLKNYSATLNSAPVVGLKGNQIMYINTKSSITGADGITNDWASFSALPDNAQVSPNDKVYLFPYDGDFYLSIGKAVWKKDHIDEKDPALKSAVNNWPAMYKKDWKHVGDNVLPTNDLAGVVPYVALNPDRAKLRFHLMTLASDGSLSYLTNDDITQGAQYTPLRYQGSSPPTPPTFRKIAYWDGHCVAIDDKSNSWNIAPNFSDGTYKISDAAPIEPVTEFTANDVGLVGLRADGYLYRRIVEAPPPGSKDDAQLKWSRWIRGDGVSHLGVASPGIILDMNLLTETLRSRYIDVQTSVYPVANRIRAFGVTHVYWLKRLLEDAEKWNEGGPDQQKLAIKNAKSFVAHAKTWSKLLSSSIRGAKDSVNIMALQLKYVHVDLTQQVVLLRDKLVGLRSTLEAQQESLSKLKAAFWGSIAAMLLGVAIAIVGVVMAQPWVVVGAGVLFVAGLVATITLAVKISELSASIASTEAQIRDVSKAIEELSTVATSFTDLNGLYGILNMFWGRMANDAADIKTMDEATAMQIGAEILADTSSIEASRDVTQRMADACQTYLDVLNKQGIKIPDDESSFSAGIVSHRVQVDRLLTQAFEAIYRSDTSGYEEFMNRAVITDMLALQDSQRVTTTSGDWFDMPALKADSSIWIAAGRSFTLSIDVPTAIRGSLMSALQGIAVTVNKISGVLKEVSPYVQQMLGEIISLGEIIQGWTAKFPTLPTSPADLRLVQKLQEKAIAACERAEGKARLANNKFADFTIEARDYHHGLERLITTNGDSIEQEKRRADADIKNMRPPWYVYLGGARAVILWKAEEAAAIRKKLNQALSRLNSSIASLRRLQSSGTEFQGKAQTWIDMAKTISGNIGRVYNILGGIFGALLEDPLFYAEFMRIEWGKITSDAKAILQILRSANSTAALAVPRALIAQGLATSDKDIVLRAVGPSSQLGAGIHSQTASARDLFTQMDTLLQSPYLKDVIGYWEDGNTTRKTLFDVVMNLRTEYVQMVATEYETIQSIHSLGLLQEYRAKNVAKGKLSLKNFIHFTSQSVRIAQQAAEKTSSKFGKAAEQLQFILNVIDNNIQTIMQNISDLDENVEKMSAELRDKIMWIVADIIALSFAAATILVAFGFVGAIAPVAGAMLTIVQLGGGATATAAAVKLVIDSLDLADLVKTIQALKALRDSLAVNVEKLKLVRPRFSDVVQGVNSLTTNITVMSDTLSDLLRHIHLSETINFTEEDALVVAEAWAQVRENTQAWMDVINEQGISPITYSVDVKVVQVKDD